MHQSIVVAIARFRLLLVALLLVTTFVTTCFAGPIGVYLALAAALASLVFAFDLQRLSAALRDWGVRCFLLSFFMLWLAFALAAQNVDDVMGFVDFLAFPVVVPAVALLARHAGARRIELVSALASLGALAAVIVGFYEVRVLGLSRASGGTSPIFFSGMAVILSFFSLLGLLTSTSRWRWLFLAGNALGFGAAILGGTRGAMLGYGAGLVVFTLYALFWWQRPISQRLLTLALVVLSTTLFSLTFFDTTRVSTVATIATEAATQGAVSDESANQRFVIYRAAIASFLESPIFGHGWWHRFEAAVPHMPELGLENQAKDSHAHLHNDVLNFASGAGIIGIAAYLVLMAGPVLSAWRSPRTEHRAVRLTAAIGLTGAYLAMGAVDTMFVYEIPKSMFVLCSAVIMGFFLDSPPSGRRAAI